MGRNADPACAPARRVGCRDELVLAAAALVQLRADADRLRPVASGAWAGVLPAEVADAYRARPMLVAVAEKLVVLEPDAPELDGWQSAGRASEAAAQAPYKPDADPSAARSFVGRGPADGEAELEPPDAQLVPSAPMAHSQSSLGLPVRSLQAELQPAELSAHSELRAAK